MTTIFPLCSAAALSTALLLPTPTPVIQVGLVQDCVCDWKGSTIASCTSPVDYTMQVDDSAATNGTCDVDCVKTDDCRGMVTITVTSSYKMWDPSTNSWVYTLSSTWRAKDLGGKTECGSPHRYADFDLHHALTGLPYCDLMISTSCTSCDD